MPDRTSPCSLHILVKSHHDLARNLEARQTDPGLWGPVFLGLPIAYGDWYNAQVTIKRDVTHEDSVDNTFTLYGKVTWEELLNAVYNEHETTTNIESSEEYYIQKWYLHVFLCWGSAVDQ